MFLNLNPLLLSDFCPTSIDDCEVWVDARRGVNVTASGVSAWMNLTVSGGVMTLTQSNPAFQPQRVISNNRPVVRGGPNQFMNISGVNVGTDNSLFFVVNIPTTYSGNMLLLDSDVSNAFRPAISIDPLGEIRQAGSSAADGTFYGDLINENEFYILEYIREGGVEQVIRSNHQNDYIDTANENQPTALYDQLGDTVGTVDFAEVIIYSRKVTGQEQSNVEKYLSHKYGISLEEQPPTLSVYGNLSFFIDAQTGVTLSGATSYVIGWEDQSNDGHDLTPWEGDVAHSPLLVDNIVNGYPVIRYPFRPYPEEPPCGLEWTDWLQADSTTIFYVFRPGGTQTYEEGGGPNNLIQGGIWLWIDFDDTTYLILDVEWDDGEDWGTVDLYSNEELSTSDFSIITAVVTEGDQRLRINGYLNDSATQIDLYYYFDWLDISCYGDVAEVIIYERILTDLEIDTVEEYLSKKYNITLVG